jgi:hypothetical protein
MWVFLLLVAGLFVAAMVLTTEVRKLLVQSRRWKELSGRLRRAWRARMMQAELVPVTRAPVRIERVSVPSEMAARGERWCREAAEDPRLYRCQPQRRRPRAAPLRSEGIATASVSSMPPSGLYPVSRPGQLVRPEYYSEAPPLTEDGSEKTLQDLGSGSWAGMSVEIDLDDLEDLVDTRPSVALTAAEAEAILEQAERYGRDAAWDQRDTQRQPIANLSEVPQEAPTGPGRLFLHEDLRSAG